MVIAEASKASNSRQRFVAMTVDLGRSRNRNRTAIISKSTATRNHAPGLPNKRSTGNRAVSACNALRLSSFTNCPIGLRSLRTLMRSG